MLVGLWEFEVRPSEGRGGSAVTKFLVRTSFFSGGTTPSCTPGRARASAKRNRNRNREGGFIR